MARSVSRAANARAGTRQRLGLAFGALVAMTLVGALVLSRFGLSAAADWSQSLTGWAQASGPGGCAVFMLAQALVAMVGLVPASLLGIAAGGVYGVWLGFLLAAAGTLTGGWISFTLARSLLRPWVERMLARRGPSRLVQLDAAVTRDGWRFVCLLRVSPVMPFAITSYALGLTEISGRDYLLGTLASLPALAGYVCVGALAQYGLLTANGTRQMGSFGWMLLLLGVAATGLLIFRSGMLLSRSGLLPTRIRNNA